MPAGLGRLLKGLFTTSEPRREYFYLPGWEGIDGDEVTNRIPGPGNFTAAFKKYVRRFDGLGSEQTSEKRR